MGPVQWGDAATAAGAFGAIMVAVAAVGIAVHGNHRMNRAEAHERQKAEDRARRASRIQLERVWQSPLASDANELEIMLQNKGPTDLYELEWFAPLLVHHTDDGQVESVERAKGTKITDERQTLETSDPETIVPGQSRRIFVPVVARNDREKRMPVVTELVTYVDADGYRIGRVYPRNTNPYRPQVVAVSQWAVVGDDYPASEGGLLGDLLKRLDR